MDEDQNLHYLIYTSKSVKPFDENVLDKILKVSQLWNENHALTGILLYHEGDVMQVLEGSEEEVKTIFEQIKRDSRHRDVHRVAFRSIKNRTFPNWSMAFKIANSDLFERVNTKRGKFPLRNQIIYTENAEDSILSIINMFIALHPLS